MGWLVAGIAGVLLLGIFLFVVRRRQPEDAFEIPLIVDLAELRAAQRDATTPLPMEPPQRTAAHDEPGRRTPAAQVAAPVHLAAPAQVAMPAEREQPNGNGKGAGAGAVGDPPSRDSTRVPLTPQSTVQFLPGRLEVLEGEGLGQEIRLFRISSLEDPEITFGRSEGPEYRHVQLQLPTVSRMHARIRYRSRRWRIGNLSEVNPVVVNGQEMGEGEELVLEDGDEIRIGEAVLRFRSSQR